MVYPRVTGTAIRGAATPPGTLNLARGMFFHEGRAPATLINPHVLASWQRCRSLGIDPERRPEHDAAARSLVGHALERSAPLIRAAEPVVRSIVTQTDGDPNVVLVTDPQGLVLLTAGNQAFAAQARRREVRTGVPWGEDAKGTNAMGTALIERAPVVIHGGEHYLSVNSIFTCTAAPIHGPDGDIVGVLDITGDARVLPPYSKAFARLAVELIEHQLFRQTYPLHLRLRFHSRPEYVDSVGEGLAVLEGDGRLLAVNRAGLRLLALEKERATGRAFDAVFDARFSEVCDVIGRAVHPIIRLHLRNGTALYARLEGGEARPCAVPASQSPAGAGSDSLRDLERSAVRQAMEAERGNVSAAARRLGVARSTLYRKLKQRGAAAVQQGPKST